jgi:ABC-type sugar transport system ATPase subunit
MIALSEVTIRQGTFTLERVTLTVPTGAYGVLMGRTGSGKTTLLEALCGLRPVCGGTISLVGRDVTDWSPAARGVGYVPQDMALFSTLTVRDHLAFALAVRGWRSAAIRARVQELARWLGIDHLLRRRPRGLSGGESQRVALGRALAMRPQVLLFDEPLSALDDETRQEMYALLRRVRAEMAVTVLHVTHNRAEAECLATGLFELRDGTVRELPLPAGPPGAA